MKALVTGADGFIGGTLCEELESNGWEVARLDGGGENGIDLRDVDGVSRTIVDAKSDVVFHLAGVSGPMVAPENPNLVADVNCTGTINVLQAAKQAGVSRLVFSASLSGFDGGTVTDAFPLTIYGATKRFGEMATRIYASEMGIPSVSARIGAVYGKGRQTIEVLDQMLLDAKEGTVRYRPGGIVPLISVRDVATSLRRLGTMKNPPTECNLVSETMTERRLAGIVAVKAGLSEDSITENPKPVDALPHWRASIYPEFLIEERHPDYVPDSLVGLLP